MPATNFQQHGVHSRGVAPGENGGTSLTLPNPGTGRGYFWRAKAQDGANTGPYSSMVAFNVFTPVSFDKPLPVSPVGGTKVASYSPEFVFNNAPRTGSPGLITYVIEVATNSTFGGLIAAWQFVEQANQTKFTAASGLPPSSQLYWRVRAFEATALGPWSDTATFVTPTPVVVPPPPTGGGGGGGPCTNTTQVGSSPAAETSSPGTWTRDRVVFLKGVASDLNKAGTWGGGYGLLRKTNGASCRAIPATSFARNRPRSSGTSSATRLARERRAGGRGYPGIRIDSCDA